MPQPTPYDRQASFTAHSTEQPNAPHSGTSLDAEFNAISTTVIGILANLAKVQRDDGALKNALVTLDSLSPAAIVALGAGSKWVVRGAWVTGAPYAVSDVVVNGTATYVCGQAHTAAALFATDAAVAGRWVLLFDTAGAVPSDGSVTSTKIASGAVTADKVGFTSLDLTGSIRGQGGIRAGAAPAGSQFHGKAAAGDALVKIERTTDDQGVVGLDIIGVGTSWRLAMVAASNILNLTVGGTVFATFASGRADFAGLLRSTGGAFPTTGAGASLNYVGTTGYVTAYDYTGGVWLDLKLRGKDVYLTAGGVDVVKVTSTGVEITGTAKLNGSAMGYLGIPRQSENGAYTLRLIDVGKSVYSENVGGQVITIPAFATTAFADDSAILIINDGSGAIPLTPASGVTLRLAGTATTGSRTIGAGGMAFLKCVKQDRWFVSGPGVS